MIKYDFCLSGEQMSYEETAKNFQNDRFFYCELGNAVIFALANILRIGIVVLTCTSLGNYPVITIVPRNEPIACTTVYFAFEQLGAGHYDAVIENTVVAVQKSLAKEKLSEDLAKITHNQLPIIIQIPTFVIQHVDVAQEKVNINKTDNSVQSTNPVINTLHKAAQWCKSR